MDPDIKIVFDLLPAEIKDVALMMAQSLDNLAPPGPAWDEMTDTEAAFAHGFVFGSVCGFDRCVKAVVRESDDG